MDAEDCDAAEQNTAECCGAGNAAGEGGQVECHRVQIAGWPPADAQTDRPDHVERGQSGPGETSLSAVQGKRRVVLDWNSF